MKEPMQEPGTLVSDTQATSESIRRLIEQPAPGSDQENRMFTTAELNQAALKCWKEVPSLENFAGCLKDFKAILDLVEFRYGSDSFVFLYTAGHYPAHFRVAPAHSVFAHALTNRENAAVIAEELEIRERHELERLKAKYETHEHENIQKP